LHVQYSAGFKKRMIQRLTGPRAISATALSAEVGVPQPTLSSWLREARRLGGMGSEEDKGTRRSEARKPSSWTPEEKYEVVLEAASIPASELGEFLRRKGLHSAQLDEWRQLCAEASKTALGGGRRKARGSSPAETKRVRALERELHRKEKALAEMAALIALKKKVQLLWGDEGDDTSTRSGT